MPSRSSDTTGTDEVGALRAEVERLRARIAELEAEREELAQTDAATGLPNGRAFEVLAERELHNGSRYGGLMALLVLDVAETERHRAPCDGSLRTTEPSLCLPMRSARALGAATSPRATGSPSSFCSWRNAAGRER